jgi:hypothetical protein
MNTSAASPLQLALRLSTRLHFRPTFWAGRDCPPGLSFFSRQVMAQFLHDLGLDLGHAFHRFPFDLRHARFGVLPPPFSQPLQHLVQFIPQLGDRFPVAHRSLLGQALLLVLAVEKSYPLLQKNETHPCDVHQL